MFLGPRRSAVRWSLVGLLVVVLAALPTLVGRLPVADADRSATALRDAALDSAGVPYSGYAESAGGLTIPITDRFTEVTDLLSDRTTMRTWYRAADDYRVDIVSATGETGVHRDETGTWTWQYEGSEAVRSTPAPLALPTAADLLPTPLGRRMLSEAQDDELSRIGARRVAGRDALGVRIVPSQPSASVSRVDVWVDAGTGLPLQVQVFGAGPDAALDTRLLDLDLGTPAESVVTFTPPTSAQVRSDDQFGLLQFSRTPDAAALPTTLAGLADRTVPGVPAAVGVYGRGVTLLVVVPVPGRFAEGLRRDLAAAPGAVVDDLGVRVSAGPLGLMIATGPRGAAYLLAGTVTSAALADAAGQLPATGGRG